MERTGHPIAAAVGFFATTNVEDFVSLTVLFLSWHTNGQPRPWHIVTGYYAGYLTLVATTVIAAAGLTLVPKGWVGLLGLVPLSLGIRKLLTARDGNPRKAPAMAFGPLPAMAITLGNGADNLSLYPPVFRTMSRAEVSLTIAVFLAMAAVWCATAAAVGGHKTVVKAVERVGHLLTPVVYIAIGIWILIQSGAIDHLVGLL
jgi:cadmium resistance protein CadD (predicted permease)